jgi:hypothetical protein
MYSDFLILDAIHYIPIDSVLVTEVKVGDSLAPSLTFELFASELASEMLGVE